MRHLPLVLGALAFASLGSLRADLVITEVMASSSNPSGAANGDWFEIYNNGLEAIDLTGWSWDDDSAIAGTSFFGSITLNPGTFLIVIDESTANAAVWASSSWWNIQSLIDNGTVTIAAGLNTYPGLGSAGDSIYIYNASNTLVTSQAFGASTTGQSLAWAIDGAALGSSVEGTYGAFLEPGNGAGGTGTDVASPGYAVAAVPEPDTVALAALGLGAAFFGWRHRCRN